MSDRKNPPLELKADETVLVTLKTGKPFKSGSNSYGNWHGYNLLKDGEEYTFFADDSVHSAFQTVGRDGARFNITLKFQGRHKSYVVKEALFDERGEKFDQPKSVVDNPDARLEYRRKRVSRLAEAIHDVYESRKEIATFATDDEKAFLSGVYSPENVQKFAVSLFIEENRK